MGKLLRAHGLSICFSALLLSSGACLRPQAESNLGVGQWKGTPVSGGREVELASLPAPKLVLNVYSPTCKPCIEEIPALNALTRTLKARGIPVLMVVENRPESHGLPADAGPTLLYDRLKADVQRYGIEPELLVMNSQFRVSPRDGLVTGTPETLILDTAPLRLRYNFIGPISTARTPQELAADSRYQFVLKQI